VQNKSILLTVSDDGWLDPTVHAFDTHSKTHDTLEFLYCG